MTEEEKRSIESAKKLADYYHTYYGAPTPNNMTIEDAKKYARYAAMR